MYIIERGISLQREEEAKNRIPHLVLVAFVAFLPLPCCVQASALPLFSPLPSSSHIVTLASQPALLCSCSARSQLLIQACSLLFVCFLVACPAWLSLWREAWHLSSPCSLATPPRGGLFVAASMHSSLACSACNPCVPSPRRWVAARPRPSSSSSP
jgi:hypothetical protein